MSEPTHCGHDAAQFVTGREGTGHCPACEKEARVSERSARERFVEAMREWLDMRMSSTERTWAERWARQAIKAFARRVMEAEHRAGAHDRTPCLEACYEMEVAALLREVGL